MNRVKDVETFKEHFIQNLPGKLKMKLEEKWDDVRANKKRDEMLYEDPAVYERDLELAKREKSEFQKYERKEQNDLVAHKRPQTSCKGTIDDEEMGSIIQFKIRRHCHDRSQSLMIADEKSPQRPGSAVRPRSPDGSEFFNYTQVPVAPEEAPKTVEVSKRFLRHSHTIEPTDAATVKKELQEV